MSTCRWCTPSGPDATEFLKSYASKRLSPEDLEGSNEDLCYCLECVLEYHKAKEKLPGLHEVLWELETSRLVAHIEKSMQEEAGEDDELFVVDENGQTQLSGYVGPDFENNLRVPLLEVLKYPYLLLHERVSEVCVEVLCRMERSHSSFQVFEKYPGIYLFLVHPNEVIRRWAILTARNLGKVDRDDYYDLQEVLTCLFKVIELGLFESQDIYSSSMVEKGKLILLPSHLYDTANYKNYWLGICMLLTVLEEQALDSLLLGPDKQNDFMQSILHTMEKEAADESTDPFWPALHCFMVILDQLGSKVWGQLIDPVQAFQTIINSVSYNSEIKNIRSSFKRSLKTEPESDYNDDMVTCSQIVYSYNTEKPQKDTGWKTAICPDYCPNMYEDMQALANMLQSAIGRDTRIHQSTFLWFIPFVQSLMDLKDLGVAYIVEVIHYLCSETKGILNESIQQCEKVSEFFLLILVSIIELHRKKKCLHLLWISSQEWVEAVVKCTKLPAIAFTQCTEKLPGQCVRGSSTVSLQASNSVQHACVQLIRSLLREGYQIGQHALCKQYLDKLNLLLRGSLSLGWQLNIQETQELQVCLRQVIRGIKNRALDTSVAAGNDANSTTSPAISIRQEKSAHGGGCEMSVYGRDDRSLCAVSSKEGRDCSSFFKSEPGMQENEDDGIMLSGFSGTLLKKVSTGLKSSSLLKSEIKKAPDVQASDSKQLDLNDLAKYNCEDQISKSCFTDKNSANGRVPSSSENKNNISSPGSRIRPLSVKCGSSDRLLEFSKYFKRESSSVGKKEEDFMKTVSEDNTLTDSQVDRELSKLSLAAYAKGVNFPFDSSQESSLDDNVCDIRRKVKGVVRSSSDDQRTTSPYGSDCLNNKVIIISDSSDEENSVVDKKETKKNENENEQPSTSSCASGSDTKTESKVSSSLLSLEDCESQCFEFETELDVFSVWQDTQDYSMEVTQEYKQGHVSTSVGSSDSSESLDDHTNEWGYDMDYLNDDSMEEEANLTGKTENLSHQTEADNTKVVTDSTWQESVGEENAKDQLENSAGKGTVKDFTLHSKLTEPRVSTSKISLASKLALKKNSASPQKSIANSKVARTVQRSPKKPVLKPAQTKKLFQNTSKTSQPGSSKPAVVPPRKVRQCPAPASTVEKLGLKKAPRRAFELSQRSLESLAQLRSYGKAAGRIGIAQKQKIKLIAPQSLSIKHNKKLLACQDLQYLRQTRPKRRVGVGNPAGSSGGRNKKACKLDTKLTKQKPGRFEVASVEKQGESKRVCTGYPAAGEREFGSLFVEEETGVSKLPGFSDINIKSEDNGMMVPPVPVYSSPSSSALVGDGKNEPSGNDCIVQPECEKTKENGCKSNENSDGDDDDLFLTQLDPVDMELCSEEESVQDTTRASKNPKEVDTAESLQQSESSTIVKCTYKDCNEKVENPGEYCSKHSATSSEADHLFAKPSLLPSKPRKPSTTKIFSSASSSRNAAFSKDLEDVKKLPPASKSKVNAAKPVVVRPPNAKPIPIRNQTCKSPSFINVPQANIPNNVLQSQNRQNDNASNISRRPVQEACSSPFYVKQHDYSIFITEVLRWTYEMFVNSSLFGPPSNLTESLVAAVPVHFQGYNDYFNTFFPLMMLNAFETLAQEWIENQRVREKSYYFNLQSFSADLNTADFTAHLRESDLAKQLHPKEDDLIFLVVQKKKDAFREDSEMEDQIVNEVGLVTRFSRASGRATRQKEQHTICHLSVRTRGNLSFFVNKQVKCMVVGSLVTTHRTFKGLLLLSRSPLAKPIINPSYNDFCPRDLPVASESTAWNVSEYNEDQKRAIETAYAMVKQHPGLPKICLIHGPPGTGKSKTIVGLLSRVLRENTRNEKTQKTNSKIKPNRFLVCAPSNAAVDELMKKIIIAFKEKCQNRQEPLGNCGDIKLVRLGAEKAINSEVRGFSLDKQVEHRMKRKPGDCDQDIQKKKAALDQKLDMLSRQRAMHRCEKKEVSQMLDDEIGRLSKERQQLASQLKEARGHSQKVQADIILESDIICCTLSTSGGCLLESVFFRQGLDPFSCVIVDEAGQSCEVETLIPLIHRCNKLVLVGDPRQLPPTVKSVKAQEYGYDQSLMARLHRHLEEQVHKNILRSLPVVQLTVQYRMHPDICLFPSNYVYGRTLKTDRATEESRCSSEWPFQPYLIFDVGDGREERNNDSFSNPQEVKLVMELIRIIKEKRKDAGLRRIGIITPYSAQKKKIQEQLDRVFRNSSPEVDTVDAFQGREKDCIIVTCVRANSTKGSIGFLASLQRLNVTITRARFSLFILGRLKTLMENKDWNELIQDAQRRGAIIKTSEKSYRKDAGKILKLKPPVQPPASAGAKQPSPMQSSSSGKKPLANPKEASSPQELTAGTGCAVPQGSGGPQQPQCAQTVDSRRVSAPARMVAAVLPADQEKPRDPRLASMASRTEAKGKEQASKDSSQPDQSNPGSTSQQGFDASSAARDQTSRTEAFKKPQQTSGQCDLPSTARHEGDQRGPPLKSGSKSHSEGGESCINKQNKDYCALTRTSEESPVNTESNSAKRRKTFH
ncbi:probable helicase senataxin [Pezoporus flaviventris]|uniref:probable helicase senataxin n=1 Tax=Pezoporus flaviventris TaxID=889875 RepID=UPI002AB2BF1C|nr:probable helicase senataxin [Pezoporus flaviventris]